MAFPTSVNNQITDAVTQANTKVLGDAPAVAMGNLYQATSKALTNAAHNATTAQQQAFVICQAAATMGVSILYSLDTATTDEATKEILKVSGKRNTATRNGEAPERIQGEHVVGYIYTMLDSPQGRLAVRAAVDQANDPGQAAADDTQLVATHDELSRAIETALQAGISKQQVCHTFHQVSFDLGISLLYPFDTRGTQLSAKDLEAYYMAIIAAYQAEFNGGL